MHRKLYEKHVKNIQQSIAHAYFVNVLMENKGVNFSAGVGVGQVLGESFQLFAKASLSAFL